MLSRVFACILVTLVFFVDANPAQSCTIFCLKDKTGGAVIAKSYDWDVADARLFFNKLGVAKRALVLEGSAHEWISKYASLTFNQYGREFPNGGINEEGLVVEVAMLPDATTFPAPDDRPTISELQWIQFQLDSFKLVNEVVDYADKLRVAPVSSQGKVHYMVCDRTGSCATLEYIDGKLVVHWKDTLPVSVLTNDTYADSAKHLHSHQGFGGTNPPPTALDSLSRFVIAAYATLNPQKQAVSSAFSSLDKVKNGTYTKWNIVYDTKAMRAHFRTLSHPDIKFIDLQKLFSAADKKCLSPVTMLDLNLDGKGDVTKSFVPYMTDANLELLKGTLGKLPGIPQALITQAAGYPAALPCTL